MPVGIQKHIKEKFGVQMDPNMISNYKSAIKAAGKSAIIRSPAASAKASTKAAGGITPKMFVRLKNWLERSERIRFGNWLRSWANRRVSGTQLRLPSFAWGGHFRLWKRDQESNRLAT